MGSSTGFTVFTGLAPIADHPLEADVPLKIGGDPTIEDSEALHKALTEYFDRGLPVVLDLSEVHTCDAVLLQLIYAARRSAIEGQRPFRIAALSPAVTETAAALGLPIEDLMTACRPANPESHCADAGIDNGI